MSDWVAMANRMMGDAWELFGPYPGTTDHPAVTFEYADTVIGFWREQIASLSGEQFLNADDAIDALRGLENARELAVPYPHNTALFDEPTAAVFWDRHLKLGIAMNVAAVPPPSGWELAWESVAESFVELPERIGGAVGDVAGGVGEAAGSAAFGFLRGAGPTVAALALAGLLLVVKGGK